MPRAVCRPRLRHSVAPGQGDPAMRTRLPRLQLRRPRRGDLVARGLPGRVLPDDRGARRGEDGHGVLGRRDTLGVYGVQLPFARPSYQQRILVMGISLHDTVGHSAGVS